MKFSDLNKTSKNLINSMYPGITFKINVLDISENSKHLGLILEFNHTDIDDTTNGNILKKIASKMEAIEKASVCFMNNYTYEIFIDTDAKYTKENRSTYDKWARKNNINIYDLPI